VSLVSYRLSWATRTKSSTALLVASAASAALVIGFFGAGFARSDARGVFWCAALATATLIAVDFPGAGQARWSEFELSLPVAPGVLARSRLVLSLLFWAAPVLLALGLVVFRVVQPPREALPSVVAAAASSVLLAVGLRHTFGLDAAPGKATFVRALAVAGVIIGAVWPSSLGTLLTLLLAIILLALAHGKAVVPLEMQLGHRGEVHSAWCKGAIERERKGEAEADGAERNGPAERRPRQGSFERSAARYSVLGAQGLQLLGACLVFGFLASTGLEGSSVLHGLLSVQMAAHHASYVSRLLRLGHLPFSREWLFRYVAAPSLVAVLMGSGLAAFTKTGDELCRIESQAAVLVPAGGRLQVPQRFWRLTTGEVPRVTAPNGESHRPAAHRFGLGSMLVAYNPYEVDGSSSRDFLAYQVSRVISEQRGIALGPEQVSRRYLSHGVVSGDSYPELRDPVRRHVWLVRIALFAVGTPLALSFVIRPGPLRRSGKHQRARLTPALRALAFAAALVVILFGLPSVLYFLDVDVAAITLGPVLHGLAGQVLLLCPAAALMSALLYWNLLRRFRQMEPPPRARAWDDWFRTI
jgi:hypothetical protein